MPRDQKTFGHDSDSSDDPLFREPSGQPDDDPLSSRDTPAGSEAGGATPIGDKLAVGRHAGSATEPADSPGEWVAGSRGSGFAAGQEGTVVPEQGDRPAVESTDDPLTGDHTGQVRADASDTTDADRPAGDTEVVDDTTDTDETSDLRATRDPEVAPDSALDRGYSAPTNPDAPPLADSDVAGPDVPATTTAADATGATPASDTSATTSGTPETPAAAVAATPAAPVPGAPGTGNTTGVQAASASLVTNGAALHDDWARIQSSFVDDPQGSVTQAADLVTQVTNSLVSTLQEREQTLRGAWDTQGGSDTENLRNALRDYRAFFEQLTKL